jgi:DNA-binding MarR family transcriptional regulator
MMVLWERKQLTVKQLGEILYLDSGTLTPLLKKMETSGLLSRSRDKADERSVIVTLSQQGEELKEQAVLIPEKISKCVPLDREESKQLYHLLYKILGNSSRNPEK